MWFGGAFNVKPALHDNLDLVMFGVRGVYIWTVLNNKTSGGITFSARRGITDVVDAERCIVARHAPPTTVFIPYASDDPQDKTLMVTKRSF